MNRISRRSPVAPFFKGLITVAALAAVSLGAAFFWQQNENSLVASASENLSAPSDHETGDEKASQPDPFSTDEEDSGVYMPAGTSAKVASAFASEPDTGGSDEGSSAPDEPKDGEEGAEYAREAITGSVTPSKSVGYDYFSDAIFFGDSLSTGIPLYMQTLVPDAAVIAAQGISPGGALTSQCISTSGGRVTMLEAAKEKGDRRKVYIMLGSNALDYDEEPFIKGYSEFVQAVKAEYPDAVIYVQSIMPVTADVNKVYPSKNINNDRIFSYNQAICEMALDAGVNFVDVAQGIVDKNGFLPSEASPLDGMHLSAEYYIKWFDYLMSHTVVTGQ